MKNRILAYGIVGAGVWTGSVKTVNEKSRRKLRKIETASEKKREKGSKNVGKNGVGMGMKQGWKPGGDGIKFRNNVKRVIDEQIRETDPALAAQLQKAILFGNAPRYIPEDGLVWETMPVKNN